MSNISNSELLEAASEIYNQNVADIKKGLYGEYIKTNDDGTFTVVDKVLGKTLKIVDNTVLWCKSGMPEQYCKWFESIPIMSIKDQRYEQKFFENRTTVPYIDEIFTSPDYAMYEKNKTAKIEYMTPMSYIQLCALGHKTTTERQISMLDKSNIEKYADDMLKGDLFPLINIMYVGNHFFDQEGRHRAMVIQHLIDTKAIPEDTLIPVVIVTEV